MMHHLEQELKRHGSKGVHLGKDNIDLKLFFFIMIHLFLGMAPNNTKAFRFYIKLGFQVLREDPHTLWLGKRFV